MDSKIYLCTQRRPIIDCIIAIQNANHQITTPLIDIYAVELELVQIYSVPIKVSTVLSCKLQPMCTLHNALLVWIFRRD